MSTQMGASSPPLSLAHCLLPCFVLCSLRLSPQYKKKKTKGGGHLLLLMERTTIKEQPKDSSPPVPRLNQKKKKATLQMITPLVWPAYSSRSCVMLYI